MTNKRTLAKIRQVAWNAVHKDYKDDPECCFALGFDAGYDAVAQKVEPPVKESGEGFESLPASPIDEQIGITYEEANQPEPIEKEWVGLTDDEIEGAIDEDFAFGLGNGNLSNEYVIRYARVIEAKLKEKNNV